jgi:LmbE family N-acetylglucosaminyl deacetylase
MLSRPAWSVTKPHDVRYRGDMYAQAAVPEKVLVVAAHPDDVDFGAAGTVAAWTSTGTKVSYCIVTDGAAGGFDPTMARHKVAELRRAEQEEAAAIVGVSEVLWLGYPDGRLEVSLGLRRDLARAIRLVRPQRVICPSPQRNLDRIFASHPDHLAAGEATLCAVYPDARNPFAFPELVAAGLKPVTVADVWLMADPSPDVFVDVTEAVGRKIEALRAHKSQHVDSDGKLSERIKGWLAASAQSAGWEQGRLAEAFRRVATS